MRSSPACVCLCVEMPLIAVAWCSSNRYCVYMLASIYYSPIFYSPLNNRFTLVCAIESVVVLPIEASRATVMHIQYKPYIMHMQGQRAQAIAGPANDCICM